MKKIGWLAAVAVLAVMLVGAAGLWARQGVIKTTDGRLLEGDIDESKRDPTMVAITIHGVSVTVPRDTIASIQYADTFDEQFADRLGKLAPNDVRGRVELAQWAFDNRRYDLALRAAKDAKVLSPSDPDIATLIDTIQMQQMLDAKQTLAPDAGKLQPATAPSAMYLTDDDVQSIRRAELQDNDQARIEFLNNVRKRYLDGNPDQAATFNGAGAVGQAQTILATGNVSLSLDVKIDTDPAALEVFRKQVLPRVMVGCAASGCHSGDSTGSLRLFPDTRLLTVVYTDFYLLEKARGKVEVQDVFGKGIAERPLIDRMQPDSSLLLQYGLPAKSAKLPHPQVPGWSPMFRDRDDEGYVKIRDWIAQTLRPVPLEYGIHFTPPAPATRPAPEPVETTTPAPGPPPATEPGD